MNLSEKFACVFPGQGSQSIGMMDGYTGFPVVRETFAEASDILGEGFWEMVRDGPADKLNLTVNTQPLMLMAGIAVYRAWNTLGNVKAAFVAGHSLGEYTALVASGALAFGDALRLVRFRAEVMQQAVPEGSGAMAAILGLDDEVVRSIATKSHTLLMVNRWNRPISTHLVKLLLQVIRTPCCVNGPGKIGRRQAGDNITRKYSFTLFLMSQAAEKMHERLEGLTLGTPGIPLLHNADVQQHEDPESIKQALVRQLFSPVRSTESSVPLLTPGLPV